MGGCEGTYFVFQGFGLSLARLDLALGSFESFVGCCVLLEGARLVLHVGGWGEAALSSGCHFWC